MRPPTKLQVLANFFTSQKVSPLHHPPYSPDLSPPDYSLFPMWKIKLKGLRFADVAKIQDTVNDELKNVQKEGFLAAFQKLYDGAKACIYANGAYCE
jgi:histone-lysine N-methyltransferase SETMAR